MTIWQPKLSGLGPRYRQVAAAIQSAIDAGELTAGTKLPPQRQLAHTLGVTVGTVTRAYNEIETAGRVEARVGSGTYVRADTSGALAFSHVSPDREAVDAIDLGLALPPPNVERAAGLARAMRVIEGDPRALDHAIDYQPEGGLSGHRHCLAEWLTTLGLPMTADELIVNQGGMNGIFLALSALMKPGARLATETLSYPGLISVAAQLGLKTVPLPIVDDGVDLEALAARHDRQPFGALYLMPDYQNPTTVALSESKRRRLAQLARERDFWLIEDHVLFMPAEARGTPLYRLAPERSVLLFSLAKILGGGLRVGAMRVPETIRQRVTTAIRNQSWMPPPLMASLACQWIKSGDADRLLAWQIDEMRARHEIARQRLGADVFAGRPGGFSIWLRLPDERRASTLITQLGQNNIRVTDAEAFCVGAEPAPQAVRICISAARDQPTLEHALELVASALQDPAPRAWQTV